MHAIELDDLAKGCAAFWKNESRDAMYRVACKLVEQSWGEPANVADGLGVVLLTWNQAAFRYGSFSFDELERFLKMNEAPLAAFRRRKIKSFDSQAEAETVRSLFDEALDALAFAAEKRKTPVGVAKALHVLAPAFFPLWDVKIAKVCDCYWYEPARAADKYIAFMEYARATVASLEAQFAEGRAGLPPARSLAASLSKSARQSKTLLKLLDEYFYAKYTKGWTLESGA